MSRFFFFHPSLIRLFSESQQDGFSALLQPLRDVLALSQLPGSFEVDESYLEITDGVQSLTLGYQSSGVAPTMILFVTRKGVIPSTYFSISIAVSASFRASEVLPSLRKTWLLIIKEEISEISKVIALLRYSRATSAVPHLNLI